MENTTTNGKKLNFIILDPMENPALLTDEERKKLLEAWESAKPVLLTGSKMFYTELITGTPNGEGGNNDGK